MHHQHPHHDAPNEARKRYVHLHNVTQTRPAVWQRFKAECLRKHFLPVFERINHRIFERMPFHSYFGAEQFSMSAVVPRTFTSSSSPPCSCIPLDMASPQITPNRVLN